MLIIVGGLPATGKTTICRDLARGVGGVHLRLDTIEQAIVDSGTASHPLGPVGYDVGYALARDLLRQGLTVVADSVNPVAATRGAWHASAAQAGATAVDVEIRCSDPAEHRLRCETRAVDIAGLTAPTWAQIQAREYEPWCGEHVVVDTAGRTSADCANEIARLIAARRVASKGSR